MRSRTAASISPGDRPGAQHVAGHLGQVLRRLGVVAFVRDADDVVAEPEREEQLGSVGHEAHDPHDRESVWHDSATKRSTSAWRAASGCATATASSATSSATASRARWRSPTPSPTRPNAANHHPDILVHGYKHLRLTLSTHSEGGITENDFGLAGTIDGLIADAPG